MTKVRVWFSRWSGFHWDFGQWYSRSSDHASPPSMKQFTMFTLNLGLVSIQITRTRDATGEDIVTCGSCHTTAKLSEHTCYKEWWDK